MVDMKVVHQRRETLSVPLAFGADKFWVCRTNDKILEIRIYLGDARNSSDRRFYTLARRQEAKSKNGRGFRQSQLSLPWSRESERTIRSAMWNDMYAIAVYPIASSQYVSRCAGHNDYSRRSSDQKVHYAPLIVIRICEHGMKGNDDGDLYA
jgi:hypothetical protein